MLRRLIILLLIVGCVFGDTIVYKRLLLGKWEDVTLKKVTIDKIDEGAVWYTQKLFFGENMDTIPCKKIVQLISSDGREIEFDCSENRYQVSANYETPSSFSESEFNPTRLGGIFIAIGGGLLLSNIDKECVDCDTLEKFEDFTDEGKYIAKMGYGFIILGGILLGLGI